MDVTLSHKVLVEIVSPHYGKSLSNHYNKNALNITHGSCGCNLVAGNNEDDPLACDQPALHRQLSNTLGTRVWQPCNAH